MPTKFLPAEDGFLGLPPEDAIPPEQAKAWIIPFGLEATVSYMGGTAHGPRAILDASPNLEMYDEVFHCEPFRDYGVATLKPVHIPKDIDKALDVLEDLVEDVLNHGRFPLVLGGEHSLTGGAIRPFAHRYESLTILHFDAHADLRDGYLGIRNSHAAAMRRCLDFPNVNLVSVGIRNISAGEIPFTESDEHRLKIFYAKDKKTWDAAAVAKAVKPGPVYISIDLDGFDSSLMPATGTPEPGGLFWDEVIDVIAAVTAKHPVVGADIVELSPIKGMHACDFLAAKLAYKVLSYSLLHKK